jgi:hypothetical protein
MLPRSWFGSRPLHDQLMDKLALGFPGTQIAPLHSNALHVPRDRFANDLCFWQAALFGDAFEDRILILLDIDLLAYFDCHASLPRSYARYTLYYTLSNQ